MKSILLIYLLIISAITFIAYGLDKKKAIDNKWRIPESTLIGLCAIGGAWGGFLGMHLFHHKTKKAKFFVTVPLLSIVYLILVIYLIFFAG